MIRVLMLLVLSASTIIPMGAQAGPKEDCGVWADYTAKTMMGTGATMFGNSLFVMKDVEKPMMAATGDMMPSFSSSFHTIPLLTEEVRASFTDDQKSIVTTYKDLVIASNELQAEQSREFEKAVSSGAVGGSVGAGSGATIVGGLGGFPVTDKMKALYKKTSALAEAYKKSLIAHGSKHDCTPALDASLANEQTKMTQAMNQFNTDMLRMKSKEVMSLKKDKRALISSLEECKTAAPSIAGKITKQLKDIQEKAAGIRQPSAGAATDADIF